jgi:hypothetical protein
MESHDQMIHDVIALRDEVGNLLRNDKSLIGSDKLSLQFCFKKLADICLHPAAFDLKKKFELLSQYLDEENLLDSSSITNANKIYNKISDFCDEVVFKIENTRHESIQLPTEKLAQEPLVTKIKKTSTVRGTKEKKIPSKKSEKKEIQSPSMSPLDHSNTPKLQTHNPDKKTKSRLRQLFDYLMSMFNK